MMGEVFFIAFKVKGEPQPAGSKRSYVPLHPTFKLPYWHGSKACRRCFGRSSVTKCTACKPRIVVSTVDDCEKSRPWKDAVHLAARSAMLAQGKKVIDAQTEGRTDLIPLKLVARFYQTRPDKHYRTGKFSSLLRDDAPIMPTNVPDATKLTRAIEDGMIGAIYKDDCSIVRQVISKEFGTEDCVKIEIWKID